MEFLILIIPMALMMFFMSRSSKKQQQQRQDTLNAMKVGDEVITIGGLHGVLSEVNEKTVVLDCEGIYLEFEKSAMKTVTPGKGVVNDDTVTTVSEEAEVAEPTTTVKETTGDTTEETK